MINTESKKKEASCPKCSARMEKKGLITSGNSKFIHYTCTSCSHSESRCEGMLPERERY